MRRILLLCLLILVLGLPSLDVRAQTAVDVVEVDVEHVFGNYILFTGRLTSLEGVAGVDVVFFDIREPSTRTERAVIQADGRLQATYQAAQGALRPFAPLNLYFRIYLTAGGFVDTQRLSYTYTDNRFTWASIQEGPVTVYYWPESGPALGQDALDAARIGQARVASILPLALIEPVQIYVYGSAEALRGALVGQDWSAGHAIVDLNLIMIGVPPGDLQQQMLQREVPHELTHVILYQIYQGRYASIPTWLREGLAGMAELYPNPDYAGALRNADQRGGLLQMDDLCLGFPPDASRAYLAYAQADSFTRYLFDTFGQTAVFNLVNLYADGVDCETGAARVTGQSLSRLDSRWREAALGQNPIGAALRGLLPFILLLIAAVAAPLISLAAGRRRA